jgi:hypothetical protein
MAYSYIPVPFFSFGTTLQNVWRLGKGRVAVDRGFHIDSAKHGRTAGAGLHFLWRRIGKEIAGADITRGELPMRSFLACVMVALASGAPAHDAPTGWRYDPYCCNGDGMSGDCQMIPWRAVRVVEGGFLITIKPGDHREITRRHVFIVPQRKAMRSPDGAYHLCLFPNEDTPHSFYAPGMDF